MPIRRPVLSAGFIAAGLVFAATIRASAESAELQPCAAQYQAAKAENKLNGQAWQDFYPECKARLAAAPAVSATETPAAAAPAAAAPAEPAPAPKIAAPEPAAAPVPAAKATPAAAKPEKPTVAGKSAKHKKKAEK